MRKIELTGSSVKADEHVHHIDGNKHNAPENLEVLSSSEHARRHIAEMLERRRRKHGY